MRASTLSLVLTGICARIGHGSSGNDQHTAAHHNMARLLHGYDDAMYKTMRDDEPRTAAYTAAIEALAPGKVVLDIGTVSSCHALWRQTRKAYRQCSLLRDNSRCWLPSRHVQEHGTSTPSRATVLRTSAR